MSNVDYYNNSNTRGIMLYIPRRLKMNPISNSDRNADAKGDISQTFVKWISNTISYCMIQRTPLCLLNHYHHYFYDWNHDSVTRKNLFEQWNQILDLVNKIPFSWKTTFSDLYQRILKIKKINIARTGHKITIESTNELIEDISFKVDRILHLGKENIIYDDANKTIITLNQLKPNSKIVLYVK